MTRNELLRRFPNASPATIQANEDVATVERCGSSLSDFSKLTTADKDALYKKGIAVIYGQNNARAELPATKPVKLAPTLAGKSGGKTSSAGRPHCRITQCRVKLLDVDSKWSAVKDLLDALVACGALPGDREDQITLEVQQVKVAHFAEEKTLIEITFPCGQRDGV